METRHRHSSRTRGSAVLAAIALALVATTPTAAWPTTTEPHRRTDIPDAGISVAYPRSWAPVPFDEATLRQAVREMRRENPKLARNVTRAARTMISDAARLVVVDDNADHPGALLVLVVDLPTPTEEDLPFVRSSLEQQGITLVRSSTVTAGGVDALRLDARVQVPDPYGLPAQMQAVLVFRPAPHGTTLIEIVARDNAAGEAQIDRILSGVRSLPAS